MSQETDGYNCNLEINCSEFDSLNDKKQDSKNSCLRIAVLASGSGSNLASLINAIDSKNINNAKIKLVISNKIDAYALTRAKDSLIKAIYIQKSLFNSDEDYDLHLIDKLIEHQIDIVLLAGYLRIITQPFLDAYKNRILNIHPSLLPEFGGKGMYGMKVHQAVIDSKSDKSGCTVHIVTQDIDEGPILAQAAVEVKPDDTAETLAAKVLKEEHRLYPQAVNKFITEIFKYEKN